LRGASVSSTRKVPLTSRATCRAPHASRPRHKLPSQAGPGGKTARSVLPTRPTGLEDVAARNRFLQVITPGSSLDRPGHRGAEVTNAANDSTMFADGEATRRTRLKRGERCRHLRRRHRLLERRERDTRHVSECSSPDANNERGHRSRRPAHSERVASSSASTPDAHLKRAQSRWVPTWPAVARRPPRRRADPAVLKRQISTASPLQRAADLCQTQDHYRTGLRQHQGHLAVDASQGAECRRH